MQKVDMLLRHLSDSCLLTVTIFDGEKKKSCGSGKADKENVVIPCGYKRGDRVIVEQTGCSQNLGLYDVEALGKQ